MAEKYSRILRAITEQPWAIRQATLDTMCAVVAARAAGVKLSQHEIRARIGAAQSKRSRSTVGVGASAVGVVPIYGVLAQKANMFTEISGGTSYQMILKDFRDFRDDPNVKAIVFDIDSPGGEVFGLEETAEEIYAARGTKPLIAVCNPMTASAALYLACACEEIVVTPSGAIGSIGTIVMHVDYSKQNDMIGVAPTYITSSEFKAEGNPDEPLSDEAVTELQTMVNAYGDKFEAFVAKGRKVSVSKVRSDFGRGRMLLAADALKVGLADTIETYDQTVARALGPGVRTGARAALRDGDTVTIAAWQGPHGHVEAREDGQQATCGGPDVCQTCAAEAATLEEVSDASAIAAQLQADRDAIAVTLAMTEP
jgi:signal peptide peptidase SppA